MKSNKYDSRNTKGSMRCSALKTALRPIKEENEMDFIDEDEPLYPLSPLILGIDPIIESSPKTRIVKSPSTHTPSKISFKKMQSVLLLPLVSNLEETSPSSASSKSSPLTAESNSNGTVEIKKDRKVCNKVLHRKHKTVCYKIGDDKITNNPIISMDNFQNNNMLFSKTYSNIQIPMIKNKAIESKRVRIKFSVFNSNHGLSESISKTKNNKKEIGNIKVIFKKNQKQESEPKSIRFINV